MKTRYEDWLHLAAWQWRYDRKYKAVSVWSQIYAVYRTFVRHFAHKKADRLKLFDFERLAFWRPVIIPKTKYTFSDEHERWDIQLSQLAGARVCGLASDGHCPHPFEVNEGYWIKERLLPIFSSYARKAWTPKFGETEDVFDAKTVAKESGYTLTRYTINNDQVHGAIWHRGKYKT